MATTVVENPCWFMIGLRVITVIQFKSIQYIYIYVHNIYIRVYASLFCPSAWKMLGSSCRPQMASTIPTPFLTEDFVLKFRTRVASTGGFPNLRFHQISDFLLSHSQEAPLNAIHCSAALHRLAVLHFQAGSSGATNRFQ